jgi:hypothetical protein
MPINCKAKALNSFLSITLVSDNPLVSLVWMMATGRESICASSSSRNAVMGKWFFSSVESLQAKKNSNNKGTTNLLISIIRQNYEAVEE